MGIGKATLVAFLVPVKQKEIPLRCAGSRLLTALSS